MLRDNNGLRLIIAGSEVYPTMHFPIQRLVLVMELAILCQFLDLSADQVVVFWER